MTTLPKITMSRVRNVEGAYPVYYAYSGKRKLACLEKDRQGRWSVYQSDASTRFFFYLRRYMNAPRPYVITFDTLREARKQFSRALSESDNFDAKHAAA